MPSTEPERHLLHRWLDSWRGIGDVVRGLARQDFDVELRRFNGCGWRATFFPSGFEHSFTSSAGSAFAMSPWEVVQRAAADTLAQPGLADPQTRNWTATDESPR